MRELLSLRVPLIVLPPEIPPIAETAHFDDSWPKCGSTTEARA